MSVVGSFVVVGAAPAAACEEVGDGLVKIGCQPPPPAGSPAPEPSEPSSSPGPQSSPSPVADAPNAAAELLAFANAARAEAGVAPLTARPDVVAIAADHSRAMAGRGDIWHNDAYFSRTTRRQLDASRLGENVALNADVADAHRRLMASPPHRANLLDGRFTVVGIAVARDAGGTYYVTQDFLTPAPAAAAPPPAAVAPAPVPLGDVQRVVASAAAADADADASPTPLRSGGGYVPNRAHIHRQNGEGEGLGAGVAGGLAGALLAAVGGALVAVRRAPRSVTARRWDR